MGFKSSKVVSLTIPGNPDCNNCICQCPGSAKVARHKIKKLAAILGVTT